jgi:hypothetical protein
MWNVKYLFMWNVKRHLCAIYLVEQNLCDMCLYEIEFKQNGEC